MALEKAIKQDSGYDATYWRIVHVNLDWITKGGRIVIAGYKDRDARLNRPRNGIMQRLALNVSEEMFNQYFLATADSQNLEQSDFDRSLGYQLVKQKLPELSEATDWLEVEPGFSVSTTDLTANFTDESTSRDSTVEKWTWDFGDGSSDVVVDSTTDTYTNGDEDVSHTYASSGTYTVTLKAVDGENNVNTTKKEVTV